MPDTRNATDCLELLPTNFSIFTLKNMTLRTYLISFTIQYNCFLFSFVYSLLPSSDFFKFELQSMFMVQFTMFKIEARSQNIKITSLMHKGMQVHGALLPKGQ